MEVFEESKQTNIMMDVKTAEAAKALFILQTSPVVVSQNSNGSLLGNHNFMPSIGLLSTKAEGGKGYIKSTRTVNITPRILSPKNKREEQLNQNKQRMIDETITQNSLKNANSLVLDENMKPGPALLALLNLNRIYKFDEESRLSNQHDDSDVESASDTNNNDFRDTVESSDEEMEEEKKVKDTDNKNRLADQDNYTRINVKVSLNGSLNDNLKASINSNSSARERSESISTVEKRFSKSMNIADIKVNANSKVGHYSKEERRKLIERFLSKRTRRIWRKRVKYDVRKSFADSRLRVKGRFVRKEDEDQLRELLTMAF